MFNLVKASSLDMENKAYLYEGSGYQSSKKTPTSLSCKPSFYWVILEKHEHVFTV